MAEVEIRPRASEQFAAVEDYTWEMEKLDEAFGNFCWEIINVDAIVS